MIIIITIIEQTQFTLSPLGKAFEKDLLMMIEIIH